MSTSTRLASGAIAIVTLVVAGFIIGSVIHMVVSAGSAADTTRVGLADANPPGAVVAGQATGELLAPTRPPKPTPVAPSSSATPSAQESAAVEPTPSETATPDEKEDDDKGDGGERPSSGGFSASVVACESVGGGRCRGETDEISDGSRTIWVMVYYDGASSGDRIGMAISGPGGTRDGATIAVRSDQGRVWSAVSGRFDSGSYTLIATRNGDVVAESSLRVD
jgi:hypothetical protein